MLIIFQTNLAHCSFCLDTPHQVRGRRQEPKKSSPFKNWLKLTSLRCQKITRPKAGLKQIFWLRFIPSISLRQFLKGRMIILV